MVDKGALWRVLVDWLGRYIPPDRNVIDLGAGRCWFINRIPARRKTAIDKDVSVRQYAAEGVDVLCGYAHTVLRKSVSTAGIDYIFASNFFEHLSQYDICDVLAECYRALRRQGQLIIIQPNAAVVGMRFYDFPCHKTPLTHTGMCRALESAGFTIDRCVPRFLPYTTAGRRAIWPWLLWLYLRMPIIWRVFGEQMFIVARKGPSNAE